MALESKQCDIWNLNGQINDVDKYDIENQTIQKVVPILNKAVYSWWWKHPSVMNVLNFEF